MTRNVLCEYAMLACVRHLRWSYCVRACVADGVHKLQLLAGMFCTWSRLTQVGRLGHNDAQRKAGGGESQPCQRSKSRRAPGRVSCCGRGRCYSISERISAACRRSERLVASHQPWRTLSFCPKRTLPREPRLTPGSKKSAARVSSFADGRRSRSLISAPSPRVLPHSRTRCEYLDSWRASNRRC